MPDGVHLFTDRYYTTPKVAAFIKNQDNAIYLTGTCMGNRMGIPWKWFTHWNQKESERGFYRWLWEPEAGLYATIWKDRNVVPFVSTGFGVLPVEANGGKSTFGAWWIALCPMPTFAGRAWIQQGARTNFLWKSFMKAWSTTPGMRPTAGDASTHLPLKWQKPPRPPKGLILWSVLKRPIFPQN
jgi:hypothetical protein